jgi:predicted phosphohydrolase
MRLFAIGDLHLPGGQDKPMDVFGIQWRDHVTRLREAWHSVVHSDDWVLVPGDISWAMRLEDVLPDLAYLGDLPGHIVLLRGNHDYWWQGIGKVRQLLPSNVQAIQNDCVLLPDATAVCGARGWDLPSKEGVSAHDIRIYERELQRLRFSLEHGRRSGARRLVAMMHFPPAESGAMPTGFTEILEEYGVALCVYGHLHGEPGRRALQGCYRGVFYQLVAADALGFRPWLVDSVC